MTPFRSFLASLTLSMLTFPILVADTGNSATEPGATVSTSPADKRENDERRRANARKERAAELVREADRLNRIYLQSPTSNDAAETRRLEARALIEAAREGDTSQALRLAALVESVRRDPALPQAKRCEIVAMRKYQETGAFQTKDPEGRYRAIERIERSLIAEFPDAPNGYEALFRLALNYDEAKGRVLAEEVGRMPKAPAMVKTNVKKLLARYALIGTDVKGLLPVNDTLSVERGAAETIIYAWSSTHRSSITLAQRLQKSAAQGTSLVGICLDRDEAVGRATAAAAGLTGVQIYDGAGQLAVRLQFDQAGLAYLVGKEGLIRSVSAARELSRRAFNASQSNAAQTTEAK